MKLWIARDKDDSLYLYKQKPQLTYRGDWINENGTCFTKLPMTEFPEITFENSPKEIKLRLVSKNVSESIVNEFMNTLNFTYDKSEKCMVAKIHNADLTSLKNIIESKL